MRILISLFALIFITNPSVARTCKLKVTKVAVVDTGLNLDDPRFEGHICKDGNTSYVGDIKDTIGHGTHVTGLILKYGGDKPYCFMIYKYYDDKNTGRQNLLNEISAFRKAVADGADIVNFSSGGSEFDEQEYLIIKQHPEVTFVVAAGNEGRDFNLPAYHYYPASYKLKNMVIVGNLNDYGVRNQTSNYGEGINAWENGTLALSSLPGNCPEHPAFDWIPKKLATKLIKEHTDLRILDGCNGYMTGTSMAAAIKTGKIVANKKIACDSE